MKLHFTINVPNWLDRLCTWPVIDYRSHKYGYSFRKIYLGEGEWTIVDTEDYYRLNNFQWFVSGKKRKFYAIRNVKIGPDEIRTVRLHREIMNAPDGLLVDHINNNTLDNRRANLRLATYSQNACNTRRKKSKTSSRFRGVHFMNRSGRWGAHIMYRRKSMWLGSFKSEIDAAKAYDAAARKYHGEFAKLNFCEEVATAKSSRYNADRGLVMIRSCRAIVCCLLFAMLIVLGCKARRAGFTPPKFLRSVDMTTTKMTLKDAKAERVWEMFRLISRIPRRSKNEGQIIEWLKGFAKSRKLACRSDAMGNTVIELPAIKGYENAPAVVLQSHVDMVCEKTPASKHDFSKDPIELVEHDGWVTADGTTLGADNGLGVSLALALADEKLPHPRLELLFTVDEETGLTGANGLQQGFITGKYLINLDGEDKSFIVGCAGGENTEITLSLDWSDAPVGFDCFELKVSGLYGGHSGIDIDKQRANAIALLARTIRNLQSRFDLRICCIEGGQASNAIPRDAQAVVCFEASNLDAVKKALNELESIFKNEFSKTDQNLKVEMVQSADCCKQVLSSQCAKRVINSLSALPAGVYRMSPQFEGVVETSNNLARVETIRGEDILRVTAMQRGFEQSSMADLAGKIVAIAELAGAKVKASERYPAWKPDTSSSLLTRAKEIYKKLNKKESEVRVVHAGLEPAVIGEKFPGIEMISVGPTIKNPHSPQERVEIASVDAVWEFLIELISFQI